MRTRLQVNADEAAFRRRRVLAADLRRLREDAGVSKVAVASIAGIDPSYLTLIELGRREPSASILGRVAAALGAEVSVRLYPSTRPPIRDHLQARMIEALLRAAAPRWQRFVEVPVRSPVRGIIDVVLFDPPTGRILAIEAHSELRRLEQQIRWAGEKAGALPSSTIWPMVERAAGREVAISRVLLLRSTVRTRELARSFRGRSLPRIRPTLRWCVELWRTTTACGPAMASSGSGSTAPKRSCSAGSPEVSIGRAEEADGESRSPGFGSLSPSQRRRSATQSHTRAAHERTRSPNRQFPD